MVFCVKNAAPTALYTLSLHDALPILIVLGSTGMVESALTLADSWNVPRTLVGVLVLAPLTSLPNAYTGVRLGLEHRGSDRKSTRLNSSHVEISYAVFCLKKKSN